MQEEHINYIYEGYFNNVETQSDELVKDIEQNAYSNTSNPTNNIFDTVLPSLYIIPSKLEDVLRNVNFKSYLYNINRVYEYMTILDTEDEMHIVITESESDTRLDLSVEEASKTLLDKIIEISDNVMLNSTSKGFEITITFVQYVNSITRKPKFDRFVNEIKRLISAVYPLYNIFNAVNSSYSPNKDNNLYFMWVIDGIFNQYGSNSAFKATEWRYKGYQVFYNKLYSTDEQFFSDDKTTELYKKQFKQASGTYNINKLFKICHKLQFSDVNEQQYAYKLEGYYDFGEGSHRDVYIEMMPMTDADNVLSKMTEWIKTNIIDRMSYADSISLIGANASTTVNIYVAVMTNDKPVFDLNKSGKADKISGNKIINEQQYITYEIVFLDAMFSRFGQKRKAIMSKHYENAVQYHYQYRDDLKDGLFGRNQQEVPYTYFSDLKDKLNQQQLKK